MIIYVICFVFLLARIERMLIGCRLTATPAGHAADDDARKFLPIAEIALLGSIVPVSVVFYWFYSAFRRRHREANDLCLECGRPIEDRHGRCPGCGTRLGPDRPRVHTLCIPRR
jgi:hypothetical protein